MAIGRYPIPPPNPKQMKKIFGSSYDEFLDPSIFESSNSTQLSVNSPLTRSSGSRDSGDPPPPLSIFALLDYIVLEPPPTVPLGVFTPEFKHFVDSCLQKDPNNRPDMNGLMVSCLNCVK